MGNSKASSVAPRTAVESPGSIEFGGSSQETNDEAPEQARDFHFAVTWVTLFAHLDPIEAAGPRRRVETPAPTLALVPVVAAMPLMEQHANQDYHAAWEMVVPKMVRTADGNFTPAETGEQKLL
jgi:hypothetical protein